MAQNIYFSATIFCHNADFQDTIIFFLVTQKILFNGVVSLELILRSSKLYVSDEGMDCQHWLISVDSFLDFPTLLWFITSLFPFHFFLFTFYYSSLIYNLSRTRAMYIPPLPSNWWMGEVPTGGVICFIMERKTLVFVIILSLFTFYAEKNVKFAELIWFVESLSSAYSSSAAKLHWTQIFQFQVPFSNWTFDNYFHLFGGSPPEQMKNIVTDYFWHSNSVCLLNILES